MFPLSQPHRKSRTKLSIDKRTVESLLNVCMKFSTRRFGFAVCCANPRPSRMSDCRYHACSRHQRMYLKCFKCISCSQQNETRKVRASKRACLHAREPILEGSGPSHHTIQLRQARRTPSYNLGISSNIYYGETQCKMWHRRDRWNG